MRISSLVWALPLLLLGCSAKDAVSLSVQLSPATVAVKSAVFGGAASGSFQLTLTLGPEASGPTTVTLENFSLETLKGEPLVPVLSLEPATAPLVINKGDSKNLTFTFTDQQVDHDAACAGQVEIRGSLSDTLKGGTDPVVSAAITPDCS
jgi:acyl CoA:acetate/3-ketoacid CoA transferase alpha subunit